MPKNRLSCDAQTVVEHQSEAIEELRRLQSHPTVMNNTVLRSGIQKAWKSLVEANAYACILYFRDDTHADVAEFVSPAGAA